MERFGRLPIIAALLFTLEGCGTRATTLATVLNAQQQGRDANAAYAEQGQQRQLEQQLQQALLLQKVRELNAAQSAPKGN